MASSASAMLRRAAQLGTPRAVVDALLRPVKDTTAAAPIQAKGLGIPPLTGNREGVSWRKPVYSVRRVRREVQRHKLPADHVLVQACTCIFYSFMEHVTCKNGIVYVKSGKVEDEREEMGRMVWPMRSCRL